MLVRARVDPVLARIMLQLRIQVPPFLRLDGLVLSHVLLPADSSSGSGANAKDVQQQQQQHQGGAKSEALKEEGVPCALPEGTVAQPSGSAAQPVSAAADVARVPAPPPASSEGGWGFKLAVHSVHGQACVMPMVRV